MLIDALLVDNVVAICGGFGDSQSDIMIAFIDRIVYCIISNNSYLLK